jgi:alpha-1,2-mannosyltransferase
MHPFCNDCGGGEKVLWMIIKGLVSHLPDRPKKLKINILAGIKDDAEAISNKLKDRFDIEFANSGKMVVMIEIIRLKTAYLVKPQSMLTMLLQILGQIVFAFEIITTVYSDAIVDTTGLPFTYSILSLFGRTEVNAYVHYPFISNDMINDVKTGAQGVHSRGAFSKFKIFRGIKVYYYYLILLFYRFNGFFLKFAFCNSTWTYNHIKSIWKNTKLEILYPPCSTTLYESKQTNHMRKNIIVSFAQFRPEKNHKLQIDIFNKLKQRKVCRDLQLNIIGSIRDEADKKIYNDLIEYINKLNLSEDVQLFQNLAFQQVKQIFEVAKMGIHTMRDEHFGISIIEMMAAGLIVIAHKSAGALNDIIGPSEKMVGILAESKLTQYIIY